MRVTPMRVTCKKCGWVGDLETVADAPVSVWTASVKALHCGNCGAGYKSLGFGGEIAAGKPDSTGTIAQRKAWWRENGDVGISSATIFWCFTGIVTYGREQGVPMDPADFSRCKTLLDLIPEWRGRLDEVKTRLPWWTPMVDNWDEMERLFAEESQTGQARGLYDFMQPLVKQCWRLRSES